jgi:hypothetical protein
MNNTINRFLSSFFLRVDPRSTAVFLGALYFVCLGITYLTLVAPGLSYVKWWLNDVMGLIDIANRVHLGEVPYKDFHLIYGPLVALIPAWGFDLGLSVGAIFGFQGLVVGAFLLMCAAIALPRRVTMAAAMLIFLLVWLLSVVPLGETQSFGSASWGTYYNRQGWAALILIFLFYLEPKNIKEHDKWLDAAVLSALVLFEIYNKFTFGIVALSFIFGHAVVSRYSRQVSLRALILLSIAAASLELIFHFHVPYFRDIVEQVAMVAGSRLDKWQFINLLITNSAMILSSIGAALAVWAAGRRSKFDWIYLLGVILATILLRTTIGDNQLFGTIALVSVFVCFGELARRTEKLTINGFESTTQTRWGSHVASLGCLFLAVTFVAAEVANRLITWHDFYNKIQNQSTLPNAPKRLASLMVPTGSARNSESGIKTYEYMETLIEGTNMLLALNQHNRSVITFDQVNPFPYAADMKPPVRGRPLFWLTWAATSDTRLLPSPKQFLGEVDYVMMPLKPQDLKQLSNMNNIYGVYLRDNFKIFSESPSWELWARTTPVEVTKFFLARPEKN